MDTLHAVLRSLRGETKARPDHVAVFREFFDHLDRIGRRDPGEPQKRVRTRRRRAAK
ncbi:hypothetical protein PQJ75_14420 [Rhodoplanes sp. TEM]|uniref:Uncharacterized protein n=1 Tax=Rhodoplanes tepidamans TaxID=200616 RepID=A0ABT5JE77_RHOTP|nr:MULTISPECIES: hypothetical protein [Rhodoplanes]MDC7787579.1 hypothetical protein [Rhodoplanes tepidamans]MDC7984928.1 hypothetical protein [Rhodoplanes sp. TEM]MDQ0358007.1 hypothetical protein [Rhodoplanes tepidamans]